MKKLKLSVETGQVQFAIQDVALQDLTLRLAP